MFGDKPDKNLEIWSQVDKTDPSITEKASIGSFKFTNIDGYSMIKNATELFGPIGTGWKVDAEYTTVETPEGCVCACDTTLSYRIADELHQTPTVRTFAEIAGVRASGKTFVDEEAAKKALTDGIKKSLSYLGFNADIFLGKFDDDRYVAQRKKEEKHKMSQASQGDVVAIKAQLIRCKTLAEIEKLSKSQQMTDLRAIASREMLLDLSDAFQKRRKDLAESGHENTGGT